MWISSAIKKKNVGRKRPENVEGNVISGINGALELYTERTVHSFF